MKNYHLLKLAAILLMCNFLLGADAFTYPNPFVKVANLYYNKKMYPKSLDMFLRAENTVKDKNTLNFNIANAYYKTGDFENALKYYEKSLKNDDRAFNSKVMFNMGNSFFKMGDFIKAYGKYKSSLKLDPKSKNAKYNLEFVLSLIDESNKSNQSKQGRQEKRAKQRTAAINQDSDGGGAPRGSNNNNEAQTTALNYRDNINDNNAMDDISEDDARRILSTLTEKVMVRVPMKKESLTKRGDLDEKDW